MSGAEEAGLSPRPRITPFQQMLASCSGAILTSLLVTPLDVVKIRLQAQQKSFHKGSCFLYCNGLMDHICAVHGNGAKAECVLNDTHVGTLRTGQWYQRPGHFSGTADAFIKIARYEGIGSLWSGLPPTLVMAVPATVVYFTTYDQLKELMGYRQGDPGTEYIPVLSGAIARVFAATLISPLELVRTKMQSQQLSYSEIGHAVKSTVQQEGLFSLMRGLGPTLLRDVPFSAIYWYGYERIKALQLQRSHSVQPTFIQSFTAGALAGSFAAVITLPFDVVKTHRQIELGQAAVFKQTQPSSTWKIIQRLYSQNGASALFAGLVPRLIKVAPACAIMISTYEFGKAFFRRRNSQKCQDTDTHARLS